MDRILATHTGSLIRPPELLAYLAAKERGQAIDEDGYQSTLRDAVADVVGRQVEAGIDVIDDGEMGKASGSLPVRAGQRDRGAPDHSSRAPACCRRAATARPFPGAYAALDALDEAADVSRTQRRGARPDEEAAADAVVVGLHRAADLRPHRARSRHREPQGGAGRSRYPSTRSCRSSRRRAPTGSQRALRQRGGVRLRARRCAARGVQGDRRRRLHGAGGRRGADARVPTR